MAGIKVSIVIPNWNGKKLLEKNLPSVLKACQEWAKTGWEIIVVDDASTDKSVAFLKENYPQVKVVVHKKNQRFAATCNSGVRSARGKVVVLLNNDVSPEPGFLKPLIRHFKDPKVFAVGCKEKDIKDREVIYSGRGLGEFKRGFLVHWRAKDQNKPDTLWAAAGSMAVDRKKWLGLRGMDTLFRPAYWEDTDLSWRARKRGYKILFEPKSIVNHQHETTNILAFGKKQMKIFAYKNQFLFVWKNASLGVLIQHLFWLPYHLLKATLSGDFLFWRGLFRALTQLPELVSIQVFLLLLVSFLGVKALFHSGFYTSHDGEHQLIRLNHFILGLRDGQFPVRWAGPPAFNGFGYPLFIFTYRLPFYFGTLFKLIGFSLVDSIKAVFISTYILSGVLMYFAQKKLWGSNLAALVGALFYLWTPWRFSIIFVRASLGEAVCFLFFPLIIWSILSLREKEKKKSLFLGVFSLAGLLLSHAMLTFLFLPFLAALVGFCLWQSQKRKRLVFSYFKLLFLSLGLSAYYWLPAVIEKRYSIFANIVGGFYEQHFPTLRQLVYSPWGYGFSFPGSELDEMSFQVGIAQWLAVFLAIFVLLWQWMRKKKLDFNQKLISFLSVLFLVAVFLMTSSSKSYWQFLSRFLSIDFPFRYLALTTLFSSLVVGGLIVGLKKDRFLKLFLYPTVLGLLFLVFYGNRNHLRVNQYTDFPDSYYQEHPSSSNSFDEYRPHWTTSNLPQRKEAMVVETGEAKIETGKIRSDWQKFQVEVQEKSLLELNTIYYPGWRLSVDGQEQEIEIALLTGLIRFSLPAGKHEVIFKFGRTWDRMVGEIISLATLVFIGYQSRKLWKRKR